MNRKLIIQIVVSLVALFALGGVCGYAVSTRVAAKRPVMVRHTQWAERWLQRRMAADFAAIAATPEQQAQFRPLYDRLLADFNAAEQEAAVKVNEAVKKQIQGLRSQLTGEQRDAFRALMQQRIERQRTNTPTTGQP